MTKEIISPYGPPFDNEKWDHRKKLIKDFIIERTLIQDIDIIALAMLEDLWVALEAEEHDSGMWAMNLAEIYDEVSGGMISKPNTRPFEVIRLFEQRVNAAYEEGWEDGKKQGIAGEDI